MRRQLLTLTAAFVAAMLPLFAQHTYNADSYQLSEDGTTLLQWVGDETEVDFNLDETLKKVTTIAKGAFVQASVETLNTGNVETILGGNGRNEGAFEGNKFITTANFPKVKTIGIGTFFGASNLKSINAPEAETLKTGAFGGCRALSSASLPKVKLVEEGVFQRCESLKALSLPAIETVQSEGFAFAGIIKLTLGANLRSLSGAKAGDETAQKASFRACGKLKELTVLAVTPPTFSGDPFAGLTVANITLRVPAEAVDSYKQTEVWKNFNVQEAKEKENTDTWSGKGTESEPYLISSVADYNLLAKNVNSGEEYVGVYFALTQDLNFGYTGKEGEATTERIGTLSSTEEGTHPFNGHFDGRNHTIDHIFVSFSNLNTDDLNEQADGGGTGLFGYLGNEGSIKNLHIGKNSRIEGGAVVGSLVGWSEGRISNCSSQALVRADNMVGGLVGSQMEGFIKKCSFTGTIQAFYEIGGLVGHIENSILESSFARGSIQLAEPMPSPNDRYPSKTSKYIGGLAGFFNLTQATACYTACSVNTQLEGYTVQEQGALIGFLGEIDTPLSRIFYNSDLLKGQQAGNNPEPIEGVTGAPTTEFTNGSVAEKLGSSFSKDSDNLNEGYPVIVKGEEPVTPPQKPVSVVAFWDFNDLKVPEGTVIIDGDMNTPNPDDLTITDMFGFKKGDGWKITEGPAGIKAAFSISTYKPAGQSNDWLIMPQITLPDSGAYILSWSALTPDPDYRDGYEVYMQEGNPTTIEAFTSEPIYVVEEADTRLTNINIPVPAELMGKKVRLAFRNNSNKKYMLCIDNIRVGLHEEEGEDDNANNYFETFAGVQDEQKPGDWIGIDGNNDTYDWFVINFNEIGFFGPDMKPGFAASRASTDGMEKELNPDDYFVSPVIELNDENVHTLEYYAAVLEKKNPDHNYAVYITTDLQHPRNISSYKLLMQENMREVLGIPPGSQDEGISKWVQRTVDLSAYKGQRVRIVFRHFNTTDAFILLIDNVKVTNAKKVDDVEVLDNPVTSEKPVEGEWKQFCTEDMIPGGLGFGVAGTFYAAIRFTPEDLKSFPNELQGISFVPRSQHTIYTVMAWQTQGDAKPDVQHPQAQMPVPSLFINTTQWVYKSFANSLNIDKSKDLWIGIKAEVLDNSKPFGIDKGPGVDGKGAWIKAEEDWAQIKDLNEALNYNMLIRGLFSNIAAAPSIASQPLQVAYSSQGLTCTLEGLAEGTPITVYTLSGETLYSGTSHTFSVPAQQAFYIVKTDKGIAKIYIK